MYHKVITITAAAEDVHVLHDNLADVDAVAVVDICDDGVRPCAFGVGHLFGFVTVESVWPEGLEGVL